MRGPNGLTAPTASDAGTPVKSPSLRKHPTSKPLRRKRPTSSHNGDQSSRKPRSAEPLKCRVLTANTAGTEVALRRKRSADRAQNGVVMAGPPGANPMSTANPDAELVARGERFEKFLLEYMDAWLEWAPLMRAASAQVGADIAVLTTAIERSGCDAAFSSPNTSRTSFRIFLSGWFAGTRASGEMYENSRP